jgi:adenylate kinase family enzyme
MKKVLVIGPGGAGKSTFATALGAISEMPVIHLDALAVEARKEQWREAVNNIVRRDAWIMDGNTGDTMELRLDACDTVIFLDVNRWVCLWSVLMRRITRRWRARLGVTAGYRERLSWDFLRWVWAYPSRTKPEVIARMEKHAADKNVVVLKSRMEMALFLDALSESDWMREAA